MILERALILLTGGAVLLQTACAIHTPYVAPLVRQPAAYAQAPAAGAPRDATDDWWRRFGDARLDALVDQTLASNNDLARAAIAVKRARAEAGLSVINPTVTGVVTGSDARPLGGGAPEVRSYTANVTMNYEVDLFGRLAATRDAATFEARATVEDYAASRLSLIATTATLYYQLAFLDERIALARQSADYAQKALDLVTSLRGAGSASSLETAEAQQSLHSQQATLEDFERQRVAARNAIDLLLNGEPWRGAGPIRTLDGPPPTVAPGAPAALLGRRPDLRAAELRLREQLRQSDAVHAGFYPQFSLTGELGGSSTALADLFKNPVGALAANIALPFLQADQMRLQTRVAKLDYDSAVIAFRQTLYQALSEVENALADRTQYATEVTLSARSLQEARRVEQLNEVLYRAGSTTLKVWLDAQETRRQAESAYAQSVLNARLAQVTLYKALGGDA